MFNFEKLEVWQRAINFAGNVYKVTRHFPEEERFGLTNQMRRAAVSVSSFWWIRIMKRFTRLPRNKAGC